MKFELYNISKDRSEINDLSEYMPEKVTELKKKMFDEFERIGVFPRPGT